MSAIFFPQADSLSSSSEIIRDDACGDIIELVRIIQSEKPENSWGTCVINSEALSQFVTKVHESLIFALIAVKNNLRITQITIPLLLRIFTNPCLLCSCVQG